MRKVCASECRRTSGATTYTAELGSLPCTGDTSSAINGARGRTGRGGRYCGAPSSAVQNAQQARPPTPALAEHNVADRGGCVGRVPAMGLTDIHNLDYTVLLCERMTEMKRSTGM